MGNTNGDSDLDNQPTFTPTIPETENTDSEWNEPTITEWNGEIPPGATIIDLTNTNQEWNEPPNPVGNPNTIWDGEIPDTAIDLTEPGWNEPTQIIVGGVTSSDAIRV